ncbi:hypothetical protein GBAR_LOCUS17988, partial [Geodia barretti]
PVARSQFGHAGTPRVSLPGRQKLRVQRGRLRFSPVSFSALLSVYVQAIIIILLCNFHCNRVAYWVGDEALRADRWSERAM